MSQIQIKANGDSFSVDDDYPLPQFVEERGLSIDKVVVELNGDAITPSEAPKIKLHDGDQLEIVRIVAGG